MKVDYLLNNFGKQLDQLDTESKLKPEQKKVFKKIQQFYPSKYKQRLRYILFD